MATMSQPYYLLENRNPNGDNFYPTRRGPVLACVVHVTAGLQGRPEVADSSAERTAAYAASTDREVSWHSGSDTDSNFLLLPDSYTAYQCQGYNSITIGHEISKRDVSWADEDPAWVTETLVQAAMCLRPRLLALHIPFVHATKRQLDLAKGTGKPVGLISHSQLDPTRRSDPGPDFPWDRFIKLLGTGITQKDRWLGLKNPPMTGQDVGNVQNYLRSKGYKGVMRPFVYDRGTAAGVAEYQHNRGIEERGVGPITWDFMHKRK